MSIVLDGTSGITNDSGYTGDGVSFADSTPANTLVTTSGGNVGIGTSSPGSRLVVQQTTDTTLGGIAITSVDGNGAVISRLNDGGLTFRNGGLERARIDSSGDLLVGTTVKPQFNRTTGNGFQVSMGETQIANDNNCLVLNRTNTSDGDVQKFFKRGAQVGQIVVTNTTTAYQTFSDYRLKHDIAPMTGALAKVALLKPCTYKWNADDRDGEGFIAHELQAVVPDCVTGEKDAVDADGNPEYQGIDTSFLVATLTAAIQEQQALIESLTARVVALEGQAT